MKAHRLVLVGLALAACGEGGGGRGADRPFVLDPFYTQSIDCGGIVVAGSSRVDPRTLERTCARIEEILEPLEAVRAYLVERHLLVAVWGYGEDATTLPEFSRYFWAMTGAASCSGAGASGIATLDGDPPYMQVSEESVHCMDVPFVGAARGDVVLHELAHVIHNHFIHDRDPALYARIEGIYRDSMRAGRWRDQYASTNMYEFFATGVERYFDAMPPFFEVTGRDDLLGYEPELSAIYEALLGARALPGSCSAAVMSYDNDQKRAPFSRVEGAYDWQHPTASLDIEPADVPADDPIRVFCSRAADCTVCDDAGGLEGCIRAHLNVRAAAISADVPDPSLRFGACADLSTCFERRACVNDLLYGPYPWTDWE